VEWAYGGANLAVFWRGVWHCGGAVEWLTEVQFWQCFGKAFGVVQMRFGWLMEVRFWQRFGKAFGVVEVWFGVAYGGEVVRVVVKCFQGKEGEL